MCLVDTSSTMTLRESCTLLLAYSPDPEEVTAGLFLALPRETSVLSMDEFWRPEAPHRSLDLRYFWRIKSEGKKGGRMRKVSAKCGSGCMMPRSGRGLWVTKEDDVDAGWLCKTRENNGNGTQDASYMIKRRVLCPCASFFSIVFV